MRRIGGVETAGAIDFLPLAVNMFMAGLYEVNSKRDPELALLLLMSPGLIEAVGRTLLGGHDFRESDRANAEQVATVSESFARLNGGVKEILGRKLKLNDQAKRKEPQPKEVGVVKDFRFAAPGEGTVATVILPLQQSPSKYFTIVAKPKAGDASVGKLLGPTLEAVDAKVPVYDVMPFSLQLERALARPNFFTIVLLFFASFRCY